MRKIARDLTPGQSDHLRQLVKDELFPLIPKQYQIASILGVAQGNFSRFLDGERGGTMAMAFQSRLPSKSRSRGRARYPADADVHRRTRAAVSDTPLGGARSHTLMACPSIASLPVLGALLKCEGDPGIEWWMKMMRWQGARDAGLQGGNRGCDRIRRGASGEETEAAAAWRPAPQGIIPKKLSGNSGLWK